MPRRPLAGIPLGRSGTHGQWADLARRFPRQGKFRRPRIAIGNDRIIVSKAPPSCRRWDWQADQKLWQKASVAAEELRGRIASPLLLVSTVNGEKQICVGDENGSIVLMSPTTLRTLRSPQSWEFGGKITKGPFAIGNHVGCVLDGKRFVWFDPVAEKADPPTFTAPRFNIEGEPRMMGNRMLVTEANGVLTWIDPVNGEKTQSPEMGLAPAAAAVPVGPDRVLVPLSDGSARIVEKSK